MRTDMESGVLGGKEITPEGASLFANVVLKIFVFPFQFSTAPVAE